MTTIASSVEMIFGWYIIIILKIAIGHFSIQYWPSVEYNEHFSVYLLEVRVRAAFTGLSTLPSNDLYADARAALLLKSAARGYQRKWRACPIATLRMCPKLPKLQKAPSNEQAHCIRVPQISSSSESKIFFFVSIY